MNVFGVLNIIFGILIKCLINDTVRVPINERNVNLEECRGLNNVVNMYKSNSIETKIKLKSNEYDEYPLLLYN